MYACMREWEPGGKPPACASCRRGAVPEAEPGGGGVEHRRDPPGRQNARAIRRTTPEQQDGGLHCRVSPRPGLEGLVCPRQSKTSTITTTTSPFTTCIDTNMSTKTSTRCSRAANELTSCHRLGTIDRSATLRNPHGRRQGCCVCSSTWVRVRQHADWSCASVPEAVIRNVSHGCPAGG